MDTKELYYEADTRKHQQIVAERLIAAAKTLLDRAVEHDASKLEEPERSAYITPVFALNTEEVVYGSDRYKELTAQMGKGWDHHKAKNDHHIEFFTSEEDKPPVDPVLHLNMFVLIEMCCDWIAASSRRGNDPGLALKQLAAKYPMDPHLQQVIRNTLSLLQHT